MGKITRKEMEKLLSCDYNHYERYGGISPKCDEEMGTERSTGKYDGFWLLWGIFKEYIKQNIIIAVLRKTNFHSIVIRRLIKKSIM